MLASLALSPSVPFAHCADQLACLAVVGGEGRRGGVHRIERRIEHDDHQPGVAGLLDGRHDGLRIAGHDRKTLGAGRDEVLDRRHLPVIVAVILAGGGAKLDAELLGLGLGALAHLDEERIGLGLGDETDDIGRLGRSRRHERQRGGAGERHIQKTELTHAHLPVDQTPDSPAAAAPGNSSRRTPRNLGNTNPETLSISKSV